MNPHFQASHNNAGDRVGEWPKRVPKRGFGRIDHVVLPVSVSQNALVAIDLVDADWLDQQGQADDRFSFSAESRRRQAWIQHKASMVPQGGRPPSPFEQAPLYRLTLELPEGAQWFGLAALPSPQDPAFESALARLEAQWIELSNFVEVSAGSPGSGLLYPGLFAEPIPVMAVGKMPTPQEGKALSDIFSLENLPTVSTADVELALSKASADLLAVYDVGQGNANALVSGGCQATLYYDMGAGTYANQKSRPPGLLFCLSHTPKILLSHWDTDHWAGACATSVGGTYPAKKLDWIAPLQTVGPVQVSFAHDIQAAGGNVFLYSPPAGIIGSVTLAGGHTARFTVGSGSCRNNSGIVVSIESPAAAPSGSVSWLLTGDCDYQHFLSTLNPTHVVGLVAPHHGADLHGSTPPPSPATGAAYFRLAYSFGRGNTHGSTGVQHPTVGGMTAHQNAGWDHGVWWPAFPGVGLPGGDVLATCEHPPGPQRDGAVIGWFSQPTPYNLPCAGMGTPPNCSANVGQS